MLWFSMNIVYIQTVYADAIVAVRGNSSGNEVITFNATFLRSAIL